MGFSFLQIYNWIFNKKEAEEDRSVTNVTKRKSYNTVFNEKKEAGEDRSKNVAFYGKKTGN